MKIKVILLLILTYTSQEVFSQTYPTFGEEISVSINGLTFDAMEPSVSVDGNYLFFNSLNDGITTSLYYATKVNDSIYTYVGPLTGANQTITPRLDGVASSDVANNFYWTSTRDLLTEPDNCFHGTFNGTNIVNIGRLRGTFYIYSLGWIMMDAEINHGGDLLYYTNGYFGPTFTGCSGIPCEAKIGVAQKQNDSIFNKLINSDGIMSHVNDPDYLVYAPNISNDGLELYYTRILKSNILQGTEICVSVRNNLADTFSLPAVVHPFSALTPEGTTLTSDQTKMYYHKKVSGVYKLVLRYRTLTTNISETENSQFLIISPNPSQGLVQVSLPRPGVSFSMELYNMQGQCIDKTSDKTVVDLSSYPNGMYLLKLIQDNRSWIGRLMKE